ncbi:MAG TPA: hypothetical protein VGD77_17385 [Gemmatimonadaceae bacterium]
MRRLPTAVSISLLAIVASCADATRLTAPESSTARDAIGSPVAAEPVDGAPASLVSTTTLTARTLPPGSGALGEFQDTYTTLGVGTREYSNLDPSIYTQLIWAPTEVSIGFGADPMRPLALVNLDRSTTYRAGIPVQLVSGPSQIIAYVVIKLSDAQTALIPQASSGTFGSWGLPTLTGTAWKVDRSRFSMRAEIVASHPLVDGGVNMPITDLVQRLRDGYGLVDPLHVNIKSQFFYAANPCPAGQWGDGFNCGTTPAGAYAVVGAEQASPCALGSYQPQPGQLACLPAPAGSYVNTTGAIASVPCSVGTYQPTVGGSACLPAPAGRFVNTLGAITAIACAPGSYQPMVGQASCLPAPAGRYVDIPGAIAASECPAGRYQPQPGQVTCLTASAGYYVADAGAIAQAACPAGSFAANAGSAACMAAPAGYYVSTIAATSALPCAAGTFQPAAGGITCVAAPPGSYVDVPGAVAATPCVAGRYQPQSAQITCLAATPGYFVADVGAIAQLPCPAGRFAATQGSAACVSAPPGHYVNVVAATSATPCALGTYQPQQGAFACIVAPPGTYVAVTAALQPIPCPAGSYGTQAGATSASACLPAPAGTYVNVPGATTATPCAPGSYNIVPGAIACTLAELGRYVPTAGAITSMACPAGTTTIQLGSTACLPMMAQAITFTSAPPSPAYEESTYQLAAAGGASGNPVTFSTTSSACTVTGTLVRFLAPGSCTIEARQAGGGLYYDAPVATQAFTIVKLPADVRTTGMIAQLQSLATAGAIPASDAASLSALLQNAVQAFARGSTQAGVNQLGAFINRVDAMERSRRISSSTAAALVAAARKAIAAA